jgi:hypothetical protein
VQCRHDGDGGVDPRRVPGATLRAHAVRPARPLPTGRSVAEEEAGQVTAQRLGAGLARDVPLGSSKTLLTPNPKG